MPRFTLSSDMPASAEELFAWHTRPGAFERLVPPWQRIEVVGVNPGVRNGSRVRFRLRWGPIAVDWVAEHRDVDPPHGFVDEQVRGPFARWEHHHRFREVEGSTAGVLDDQVEYDLPLGALGNRLGAGRARAQLERIFDFRHHRTREDLKRHRAYAREPRLRVAITGASGLVGSALAPFLTTGGHEVLRLVRRPVRPEESAACWYPAAGELDPSCLEGIDAVVHLAGANVAAGLWTGRRKAEIRDSRVHSVGLLVRAMTEMPRPPRVLVVGSGVGYYGTGTGPVDESAPPGRDFLAHVAEEVEEAVRPAVDAGVRVVVLRIGVVMSLRGGMLARLAPFFRVGAGAVLGSGRQPVSWIALDDLVGVVHRALFDRAFEGPVNAVAPAPATQEEFARTLARVLGRPLPFRAPAAVLRAAMGELAEAALLTGTHVRPRRLHEAGFAYLDPDLETALRRELGREEASTRAS